MSLLVLKNLLRQRARTFLTVAGIAVGIATVVALGAVVGGLKDRAGEILHAYGSDFLVAQQGAADLSFSIVPDSDRAAIEARPDVDRAVGALFYISRVEGNPYFITIGVTPEDMARVGLDVRSGRLPASGARDEVLLGQRAADTLDLDVGDTFELDDDLSLTVVGVYRADNLWSDTGALAPLATIQQLAGKPGFVTAVFVKVAGGHDPSAVAESIEDDHGNLAAVEDVGDYSEVDSGIEIMDAVNIAISGLAVGIGALGVMNTMAMSIFERTREIGVLRAVGWSGRRIVRMIVGESLVLCIIAAGIGAALGMLAAQGATSLPAVGSLLEPSYTPQLFARALGVAVAVALVGAIYPVFRAVRLTPMEALRHE